ncbi:hypothetical protein AFLA_002902 [Aspergillus flavus NRRL3357]|nr:hypothetical protein AFLA_002902 [Aspergillus flavus NRRL3357]
MTPRLPQSPAGSCGYQCKGKTVLCYPSPSCCQDSNRFKPLAPTSAVFLDKLRVKTQHSPDPTVRGIPSKQYTAP